jgi:hypothetical protein
MIQWWVINHNRQIKIFLFKPNNHLPQKILLPFINNTHKVIIKILNIKFNKKILINKKITNKKIKNKKTKNKKMNIKTKLKTNSLLNLMKWNHKKWINQCLAINHNQLKLKIYMLKPKFNSIIMQFKQINKKSIQKALKFKTMKLEINKNN